MKRHLLLILALVATITPILSITAAADAPRLACERFFTDKYKTNPKASVTIAKSRDSYFRSITVNNDSRIVAEIEKALQQDKKLATNTMEEYSGGTRYNLILNIPIGKHTISVGYTRYSPSQAELFISGVPAAFNADLSPQTKIEMPDGEGSGDGHVERMLRPLLGDLDAVVADIDHLLIHPIDLMTDDNGVFAVIFDRKTVETDRTLDQFEGTDTVTIRL